MKSNLERITKAISGEVSALGHMIDALEYEIEQLSNEHDYSIGSSNVKWSSKVNEDFPKTFLASSNGNSKFDLGSGELTMKEATVKCGCCCNK